MLASGLSVGSHMGFYRAYVAACQLCKNMQFVLSTICA